MPLLKPAASRYVLYALCCLVIVTASITFVLSVYRLQRDAGLLKRERKRDYVTNKINRSFPTIAIVMSIIVCLSSVGAFIAVLLDGRTEMLVVSIISNVILGLGLVVLAVIMLGFVQNIVENFPVDIERLLVDFLVHNQTSAKDDLLVIESSNDCCTTQDPTWIGRYSQAAECNRETRFRTIYADQDAQRGCAKIIQRTALSLIPVLISEMVCGCLCLLLGLWTIYLICHVNDPSSDEHDTVPAASAVAPAAKYAYHHPNKTAQKHVPEILTNEDRRIGLPEHSVPTQDRPHYLLL